MEFVIPSILQLVGGSTRYVLHKVCGSKKSYNDFFASDDKKKKSTTEEVSHGCLNYIVGTIVCGIIIFFVVWFVTGST